MLTGITEIVYTAWRSDSPACVDRETGIMYINTPVFSKLPFEQKFYVMCHEAGHATLDTSDEFLADEFAHQAYTSRGHSLKQSVYALTRNLNFSNPEHYARAEAQLDRALLTDNFNSNNMNAVSRVLNQEDVFSDEGVDEFLGFGKKARERREQRREDRQAHQLERAEAGGGFGNAVKNILGSVFGGGAGAGVGGGAGIDISAGKGKGFEFSADAGADAQESSPNKWIWIAVAVVILIAVIWYMTRKGKKSA